MKIELEDTELIILYDEAVEITKEDFERLCAQRLNEQLTISRCRVDELKRKLEKEAKP